MSFISHQKPVILSTPMLLSERTVLLNPALYSHPIQQYHSPESIQAELDLLQMDLLLQDKMGLSAMDVEHNLELQKNLLKLKDSFLSSKKER
jgi:hypothetical protein